MLEPRVNPKRDVAETVGVKSGLGWYVSWAQCWAEYGKVYAALIIMAAFFSTIMTLLFKLRDRVLVIMTEPEWDAVVDVHLRGTFTCVRAAVQHMRAQSAQGAQSAPSAQPPDGGRIVVVGSPVLDPGPGDVGAAGPVAGVAVAAVSASAVFPSITSCSRIWSKLASSIGYGKTSRS